MKAARAHGSSPDGAAACRSAEADNARRRVRATPRLLLPALLLGVAMLHETPHATAAQNADRPATVTLRKDTHASPTLAFVPLAPQDRDQFLTSMTRTLGDVRDIRVAFRQVRYVSLFSRPLESQGVCLFQRPDRMRWEVLEPWHAMLVTDGRRVGRFDYVDGDRRRLDPAGAEVLREVLAQIGAWIGGDLAEASETYEVEALRPQAPGVGIVRLRLRPRSAALRDMIQAIELDIDPATAAARTVRVLEPAGDRMEIHFAEPVRNEPPPEGAFNPRDPAPLAVEASGSKTPDPVEGGTAP